MTTARAAQPKPKTEKPFAPYFAACDMGAVNHSSGINWSYATFTTKEVCEAFAAACGKNGYRTRSFHSTHNKNWNSKADTTQPEMWSVQYHHYQD